MNKQIKQLDYLEQNIDKLSINEIQDQLFNIEKWYIKNYDKIDDNSTIKNKIDLIEKYVDNLHERKSYRTTRVLTIINSIFLVIGFIIAYASNSRLNLGPNKLMKSKNIEIYLILLLIVVSIIIYSLFHFNIF